MDDLEERKGDIGQAEWIEAAVKRYLQRLKAVWWDIAEKEKDLTRK